MIKIAVFPGSFDPVTVGHVDIVQRIFSLFDKFYIAIGINCNKKSLFDVEQRMEWLKTCFLDYKSVEIVAYSGLTTEFCRQIGAKYIVRGIRNSADYQYEKDIAQTNRELGSDIETLFLTTQPQYAHVSSALIRELIHYQADVRPYLPSAITIPTII